MKLIWLPIYAVVLSILVITHLHAAETLPETGEKTEAETIIETPSEEITPPITQSQDEDTGSGTTEPLTSELNNEILEKPEISYDLDMLPFSTRRMHTLILEATKAGNIEKLRDYIGTGDTATMLSLGGFDDDPIDFLKQESGDENGHELLAILEEVLEAGYVHLDKGTDRELYVWPYFFAYPLGELSDRQMVELFRIVTYGDFQDMKDFGGYIFYRVGITPSGRWQFFVAGD